MKLGLLSGLRMFELGPWAAILGMLCREGSLAGMRRFLV
jgi:hypothetical protein